MVVKPSDLAKHNNFLFESSVISYGSKASAAKHTTEIAFESSVISYGSKAL